MDKQVLNIIIQAILGIWMLLKYYKSRKPAALWVSGWCFGDMFVQFMVLL